MVGRENDQRLRSHRGTRPGGHHGFRRSSALVGTPSPLVTRQTEAPSTWLVEVPLIWRAPSVIRLMPCTYASLMPPPEVFTGKRPFGHSMAPSSAEAAPSPRLQKP